MNDKLASNLKSETKRRKNVILSFFLSLYIVVQSQLSPRIKSLKTIIKYI